MKNTHLQAELENAVINFENLSIIAQEHFNIEPQHCEGYNIYQELIQIRASLLQAEKNWKRFEVV